MSFAAAGAAAAGAAAAEWFANAVVCFNYISSTQGLHCTAMCCNVGQQHPAAAVVVMYKVAALLMLCCARFNMLSCSLMCFCCVAGALCHLLAKQQRGGRVRASGLGLRVLNGS